MGVLKILWIAFVATIFIYGGVVVMLSQQWQGEQKSIEELMANPVLRALAVAGSLSVVIAFVMPGFVLKQGETPERRRLAFIIKMALLESVAIYGLVGAMLIQDARLFYAFGGFALLMIVLSYPSDEPYTPQRV